MRILAFFVHPFREGQAVGGAHRRFLEISKGLSRMGNEIMVIERTPSLSTWLSADYLSIPVRPGLKGLRRLISLMRLGLRSAKQADVLYVPVPMRLVENLIPAIVVARMTRIPLVLVFHHFAPENEYSFRSLWKQKKSAGLSPWKLLRLILEEAITRSIYGRADLAIAVSRSTAAEVSRLFKTRRIIVNGNGVDFSVFKPQPDDEKTYDSAFLGRLHPDKGIDIILRAWDMVLTMRPTAKLVLIGGNRPVDIKRYEPLLKNPRLVDKVFLTGYLSDEQVAEVLASSKLLVYPSIREGFGMAVAEAMACGLPCIVSDIPALRENYEGVAVFVKPEDPDPLAASIIQLLENETERQRIGKLSKAFAATFDWNNVVERELELLAHLAGRKGQASLPNPSRFA